MLILRCIRLTNDNLQIWSPNKRDDFFSVQTTFFLVVNIDGCLLSGKNIGSLLIFVVQQMLRKSLPYYEKRILLTNESVQLIRALHPTSGSHLLVKLTSIPPWCADYMKSFWMGKGEGIHKAWPWVISCSCNISFYISYRLSSTYIQVIIGITCWENTNLFG